MIKLTTLLWFCLLACQLHAQEEQDSDASSPEAQRNQAIVLSPKFSYFHSLNRVPSGASIGPLHRRQIRDNVDIPIDRIRFLANEQVQSELKLTKKTRASLQPLTQALKQFERKSCQKRNRNCLIFSSVIIARYIQVFGCFLLIK